MRGALMARAFMRTHIQQHEDRERGMRTHIQRYEDTYTEV
jgi:hypothetical protein